jgi:hypothetical protein
LTIPKIRRYRTQESSESEADFATDSDDESCNKMLDDEIPETDDAATVFDPEMSGLGNDGQNQLKNSWDTALDSISSVNSQIAMTIRITNRLYSREDGMSNQIVSVSNIEDIEMQCSDQYDQVMEQFEKKAKIIFEILDDGNQGFLNWLELEKTLLEICSTDMTNNSGTLLINAFMEVSDFGKVSRQNFISIVASILQLNANAQNSIENGLYFVPKALNSPVATKSELLTSADKWNTLQLREMLSDLDSTREKIGSNARELFSNLMNSSNDQERLGILDDVFRVFAEQQSNVDEATTTLYSYKRDAMRYRQAIELLESMNSDIQTMQEQIQDLQNSNSKLKNDLEKSVFASENKEQEFAILEKSMAQLNQQFLKMKEEKIQIEFQAIAMTETNTRLVQNMDVIQNQSEKDQANWNQRERELLKQIELQSNSIAELQMQQQKMMEQQKYMYNLDLTVKSDLMKKLEEYRLMVKDFQSKTQVGTNTVSKLNSKTQPISLKDELEIEIEKSTNSKKSQLQLDRSSQSKHDSLRLLLTPRSITFNQQIAQKKRELLFAEKDGNIKALHEHIVQTAQANHEQTFQRVKSESASASGSSTSIFNAPTSVKDIEATFLEVEHLPSARLDLLQF